MSATEQMAPAPEDQAPLTENLGWLLNQAAHALLVEQTARLERVGIVPRGYCVLAAAMAGEHTQTEIAQAVGLDKTTMVVTLDELEAAGLAERRPSKTDRRARVVAVTAKGRRKAAEAEAVIAETEAEILSALPAAQRDALVEGLRGLVCGPLAAPAACSRPVRRPRI